MTPIDPESIDPIIDPASGPSPEGGADRAPAAAAVPAEDEPIEEVLWRFAEENGWLDKPRPPLIPRPPEPKSIHQMTPEEMHESLPVHLRRQRPDGTYVVMGLISRMQQDLEDLTQGKRAATYPEVDEYLGYALLAEGLAPRELSAPEAVKWWRAGGSEVLAERPHLVEAAPSLYPASSARPAQHIAADPHPQDDGPPGLAGDYNLSGLIIDEPRADVGAAPQAGAPAGARAQTAPAAVGPGDGAPASSQTAAPTAGADQPGGGGSTVVPAPEAQAPAFVPRKTAKAGGDWVIAARIDDDDIPRLSGRDIIATPEIKAAAASNIARFVVQAGKKEILAYGYRMPDGTIEIREAGGTASNDSASGGPSGPGIVIFGIHGHPADGERMRDDPSKNHGFGDTTALFKWGIPMATVYGGEIAWHEMSGGQLTFTAPTSAIGFGDVSELQSNLNRSQRNFLAPKPKKEKKKKNGKK